jgi:peptide chain release factor 1
MITGKLEEMERRLEGIEVDMASPETISNMEEYKKLAKEHAELRETVALFREWKKVKAETLKARELMLHESDEEMRELAREEVDHLEGEDRKLESALMTKLLSKDQEQVKNTFLEIRAGTGGEEAALFARDLFTMYQKYAERMRWKTELLNMSLSDMGGFK